MSEPFLRVRNHHSPSCGDPPTVNDDDRNLYIGYFENPYGEQWVFTYHRESGKAELRGGDVEWGRVYEVKDGSVPGLIFGREELAWLQACWLATHPRLRHGG
jgi:hypothetical protein